MHRKNTFTSLNRIKLKKEFQTLFQSGFRIYGGFFVYRFVLSDNNCSKLGIGISKKFGNAVYRNRIKRIIRDQFRCYHFPYSINLMINQSKYIPRHVNIESIYKELQQVFLLLSDYYFLLQYSFSSGDLKSAQKSKDLSLFAKMMFYMVLCYKKHLSSKLSPACRYTPSCSIYSLEAYRVHGFWIGSYLTAKRILSCNPFGGKGYDPVPRRKKTIIENKNHNKRI